jgi:hypothetical protein
MGGLATIAVAALCLAPGIANSTTTNAAAALAGNHDQQVWVTLVTGDHVLVRAKGVVVDAAPRAGLAQFQQFSRGGDQYPASVTNDDTAGIRDDLAKGHAGNYWVRSGWTKIDTLHFRLSPPRPTYTPGCRVPRRIWPTWT